VYVVMLLVGPVYGQIFDVRELYVSFSNVRFFGHIQTMLLPFRQGAPGDQRRQGGVGLGLAIVRKIVDAHEGRIDMSTTDGRGTRFRVTLPVEPHKHGSHY